MFTTIENLVENDIQDVLKIQSETNLTKWKFEDYLKEIAGSNSICLVVKSVEKETLGFAIIRLIAEKSEVFDTAEILNIAVDNSCQKKGIGQKLFDKIKSELNKKSIFEIWLEVRKSNDKANQFYRKNGFARQFVRKNYYTSPIEDANVLKVVINYEIPD